VDTVIVASGKSMTTPAIKLFFQLLDIMEVIEDGSGIFRQAITSHLHQKHVPNDIHNPIIFGFPMTIADVAGVSPSVSPFHRPRLSFTITIGGITLFIPLSE
jgi:hypothetical protein